MVGTGGSVGASVFTVAADDVKISGFTITSVNYSVSANYAYGVLIEADNCTITGNNIVNTLAGIFCSVQSSAFISQNNISGNHNDGSDSDGIEFYGGSNNTITDNNITNNAGFRYRHHRLLRQYNRKQSVPKHDRHRIKRDLFSSLQK